MVDLVTENVIRIAVKLTDHSDNACVTNALLILCHVVVALWMTSTETSPHPLHDHRQMRAAERALFLRFRLFTPPEQKMYIAITILHLYANRRLETDYYHIAQHAMELIDGSDEWAQGTVLVALRYIVNVDSVPFPCFNSTHSSLSLPLPFSLGSSVSYSQPPLL
jgi:hypothetical protein